MVGWAQELWRAIPQQASSPHASYSPYPGALSFSEFFCCRFPGGGRVPCYEKGNLELIRRMPALGQHELPGRLGVILV